MAKLKIIKYLFDQRISPITLPKFRGVVIALSGNDMLTHNHDGSGFRYAYPKIQYKIIDGRAAIVGIEEGADLLRKTFHNRYGFTTQLGQREMEFTIASVEETYPQLKIGSTLHTYRIERWQPLNKRNFEVFRSAQSLAERAMLLERILTGNILSCAKGLGEFFDERVICKIQEAEFEGSNVYKEVEFFTFSAIFKTNVMIPQWLGLGKSASLNHGTIIHL